MNAIEIKNLKKIYKGGNAALKGISLTVAQGDFYALLGPNGAGKSTTIGILSSLVNKTSGQVRIFGHDIDTELEAAKRHIGLVPQEFNFNQFEAVEQILVNQAGYYGLPRKQALLQTEKYLKQLSLWDKRHTPARMLSGGMKRRLMIARALIHEPKLLILDEPTAGVDIELRRSMWDFLREINEAGTTIILTTHYLEEAESLCRNVAIIDKGLLVKNTSVKNLLQELHKEVFIFDAAEELPLGFAIDGFDINIIDQHCFEVQIEKGKTLNSVFTMLGEKNISIVSMRNKANRLEEMFISMIAQSSTNKEGA